MARHESATGAPPDLPKISRGVYLFQAWQEIGRVSIGFGVEPLRWSEIAAYASLTGEISEPWEARALRDMSRAFCTWQKLAQEPLCMTPDEVSSSL